MVEAARDIDMLRAEGVTKFQIDSVYEEICRQPAGARGKL